MNHHSYPPCVMFALGNFSDAREDLSPFDECTVGRNFNASGVDPELILRFETHFFVLLDEIYDKVKDGELMNNRTDKVAYFMFTVEDGNELTLESNILDAKGNDVLSSLYGYQPTKQAFLKISDFISHNGIPTNEPPSEVKNHFFSVLNILKDQHENTSLSELVLDLDKFKKYVLFNHVGIKSQDISCILKMLIFQLLHDEKYYHDVADYIRDEEHPSSFVNTVRSITHNAKALSNALSMIESDKHITDELIDRYAREPKRNGFGMAAFLCTMVLSDTISRAPSLLEDSVSMENKLAQFSQSLFLLFLLISAMGFDSPIFESQKDIIIKDDFDREEDICMHVLNNMISLFEKNKEQDITFDVLPIFNDQNIKSLSEVTPLP